MRAAPRWSAVSRVAAGILVLLLAGCAQPYRLADAPAEAPAPVHLTASYSWGSRYDGKGIQDSSHGTLTLTTEEPRTVMTPDGDLRKAYGLHGEQETLEANGKYAGGFYDYT